MIVTEFQMWCIFLSRSSWISCSSLNHFCDRYLTMHSWAFLTWIDCSIFSHEEHKDLFWQNIANCLSLLSLDTRIKSNLKAVPGPSIYTFNGFYLIQNIRRKKLIHPCHWCNNQSKALFCCIVVEIIHVLKLC